MAKNIWQTIKNIAWKLKGGNWQLIMQQFPALQMGIKIFFNVNEFQKQNTAYHKNLNINIVNCNHIFR
jgi:hypothetical protein